MSPHFFRMCVCEFLILSFVSILARDIIDSVGIIASCFLCATVFWAYRQHMFTDYCEFCTLYLILSSIVTSRSFVALSVLDVLQVVRDKMCGNVFRWLYRVIVATIPVQTSDTLGYRSSTDKSPYAICCELVLVRI